MTFDIKQHRGLSRQNDEWYCAECGKRWDVKDQDVPDCVEPWPSSGRPAKPDLSRPLKLDIDAPRLEDLPGWQKSAGIDISLLFDKIPDSDADGKKTVRQTVVCHMSTPTGVKAADTLKRMQEITGISLTEAQARRLADEYRKAHPDIVGFASRHVLFNTLPHTLYTDDDDDAPDIIKDRNGDVVLGMCRVCGRAEQELVDVPYCTGPRVVGKRPELAAPYTADDTGFATGGVVSGDEMIKTLYREFTDGHPGFRVTGGVVKSEHSCEFFSNPKNFGNPHGDGMVGDPRPSPAEITKRNIDAMERMGLITSKDAALQRINLIASSREDLTQAIENAPDLMVLVNDIFGDMMRRVTVGVHLTEFDDDWLLSIADNLDQYAQEQRPEDNNMLSATYHAARFIRAYVKALNEGKTE